MLTASGPLLLVADDLHWADTETLQFLHYLLRAEPRARLLVVATVRPEELDPRHPLHALRTGLHALDRVAEVEVGRLPADETAALAERLRRRPLAAAEAGRLFAETEGNPLFVVEAVRAGWSGQGRPPPITPKVQAVIEARLAQLSGTARDLAGVAATIGREFTTDVLAQASQAGEAALVGGLDELWRRRIVRDRGPDAYDFTHDRIREVAYLGLSPARRRHTHLLVARALERAHAGDPAPVAAQLAAHHERAGAAAEAVGWYERAAAAAQRLPAYDEAVRLLERAVALLRAQPEAPTARERELAVLTRLQGPLGIVDGYASARLAEVQRQALELAGELGVEPAPPLLRSAAMARLSVGDFEGARRIGERLRAGGQRQRDELRVVQGEYVLGLVAFWEGGFETARVHFQTAADQFRPERRSDRLARFGATTEVLCSSRLGNTLGFLGRPEAAARTRAAALARAAETGNPPSRQAALLFGALLALELRDPASVRAYGTELAARPSDLALPTRVAADALAGYLQVLDGQAAAGIDRILAAAPGDPGEDEHAPGLHAMVARVLLEACVATGDARTGLVAADGALGLDDDVRTWAAEARRRRAEFLAALGAPAEEVEAELERALEVARGQGASLLELRAATSLLRHHLAAGGDRATVRARARLEAVIAALPERGDTPDLREAAALLARP